MTDRGFENIGERWKIALLVVVALLVYGNTLWNGFTLDDHGYILHNPAVTHFSVRGLFEPNRANNVLRPVTFATLALNWAVGDDHPFGYHLLNVLLHGAVASLLYLVLGKLLEPVRNGTTVAWVAALLFVVHPIHTEAVASIVGRSELLAAGFLLAAWLLHLGDRLIPSLLCTVLALMSKESAVVFLPLAVAGDYARGKLKPLARYAWIAVVVLLYLGVFWTLKGGRLGEVSIAFLDNPLASLPAIWRILNALRIAWKYVGLLVYPATLSSDYSYNAILLYANWQHNASALVGALLIVGFWIYLTRTGRREWFLAGAIYFSAFAATSNLLIPSGTIMGERLAYLPSAGFCLAIALLWARLEHYRGKLAWAALLIVSLALATRTVARNRDWRDDFSLFSTDMRAVPGSAKIHGNLGVEYKYRGQLDAAIREFQTALRIYPSFPEVLEVYGIVLSLKGSDEEALRLLERALSLTPKEGVDYDFRAVSLAAQLSKMGRTDESLNLLNQVIGESPGYARAWANRAVIYYQRGDRERARSDAETALRLDPANMQAQSLLNSLGHPAEVEPRR
jgi:tetratricopeptide (TPR) repeat protein